MKKNLLWSGMLAILLMGCGSSSEEAESTEAEDDMEMVDNDSGQEEPIEETKTFTPVAFKQLQELLPATMGGLPRKQSMGTLESNSSYAMGSYEADDKMVLITITDKANNEPVSEERDMEVESDESTTTGKNIQVKGYPAYEMYIQEKGADGAGSMKINVKDRFNVSIQATRISLEEMRQVADALDLDKLADLK